MTPAASIQLKGIDKTFGTDETLTQVLFDIDLTVLAGELTLLVGPSGCGKTTLISIIAGILNADRGEIDIFGHRVDQMSDNEKTEFRKHNIGFIFQQFNLVPTLTVRENAAIPLLARGMPRKQALKRADEVLDGIGMASRREFLPSHLSGGQQQRVAIARALVGNPKLLVCDEPTASLDGQTGHTVLELLKQTAVQPDRCVIVVTHDSRIYEFGDRMVSMEDGRIQSVEAMHRQELPQG
jgi:putative ABC transport system ATP-binding protein